MNAYEQRKQDKIDARRERAAKLKAQSEQTFDDAHRGIAGIPPGQPILVGHHSEGRHRNALKRHDQKMRKAFELDGKAKRAASLADSSEARGDIDSDDPEAIGKIRDQIAELESERERRKEKNKEARAKGAPIPYQPYSMSNLGANIRRYKKRLEQQERLEQIVGDELKTCRCGRASFEVNPEEGRIFFHTPGRNDEAYKVLRSRGWVWSRSRQCFSRKTTLNAIADAQRVVGPKLAEIFA